MNDPEAQARMIAMDVSSRRKSGEIISDEQVLREHPTLHTLLLEQLSRLNRLEAARLRVDQGDDLTELSHEDSCHDLPAPKLTDSKGTLDLPPELQFDGVRPRAYESSVDEAEMRITLQEPSLDVNAHSTMILNDSSAHATAEPEVQTPRYCPSVRAPMAVLKLFHDGATTSNQYAVMADRFRIGRVEGDLVVPHDFWMSGRHAEIQRRKIGNNYRWFLVDLKSRNGTFVQIEFASLKNNDELFIGQERYRFVLQGVTAGLLHVTTGAGQQWRFNGNAATIGSQSPCGLKSFASDPFVDPVHAKLKQEPDGNWTIRDNHSRNGVWYRVKEIEIPANSEFQLGEQRFGFWTQSTHRVQTPNIHVASKPTP